jgi:hypothetical protein
MPEGVQSLQISSQLGLLSLIASLLSSLPAIRPTSIRAYRILDAEYTLDEDDCELLVDGLCL